MENKPLISIFIPYYNDEKYLQQSIDSVLRQSYKNFELILLNHASTDKSREITRSYNDVRIVHIDLDKNEGAGGGFLFKIFYNNSKGEYLKPFCADDVMDEECIKNLVDFVNQNKDTDLIFGNVQYINKISKKYIDTWFNNRDGFNFYDNNIDMIKKYKKGISFLPYVGSFIKKEALINIKIDNSLILLFDMSLWLQLLLQNKNIKFLNKIIAYYRIHEQQVSGISNRKIIDVRSEFETFTFNEIFYNTSELSLLYDICEINELNLPENNKIISDFVLSRDFLKNGTPSQRIIGYNKIYKMLEDELTIKLLSDTFNFGINEFRALYSFVPDKYKNSKILNFKNKRPKELNIIDLLFLLIRKIWFIITLKNYRLSKKKKKKYSM